MNNLYNFNSGLMVLGELLKNPTKLLNDKYKLTGEDFSPEMFHRVIFFVLRKGLNNGCTEIDEITFDTILDGYPQYKEICEENNYLEVIGNLKKLAKDNSFDYHYNNVKKYSLLRYYRKQGFDITDIWDDDSTEEENKSRVDNLTLESIIGNFEIVNSKARKEFLVSADIQETKVGASFKDIKERFKEKPLYGASLGNVHLNSITRGLIQGQIAIFAAKSGSGKTNYGIKVLSEICCPYYYDLHTRDWVENKSYQGDGGLFIQFELENTLELMPRFIGFLAKVNVDNIMRGKYGIKEEERVDKAIEIFEQSNVHIVNVADFNISTIESIIQEYVIQHNIKYVVFDYITENSNLSAELASANKVQTRTDQVLANLSKQLKLIARKYSVGILSFTQTNGAERNLNTIDASIISGAKAIVNTADVCGGFLPLTSSEKDIAEQWQMQMGDVAMPNRVFHLFKVRFGAYPQNCKVYIYFNLGTGEMEKCFCTDSDDNFIDVEETYL